MKIQSTRLIQQLLAAKVSVVKNFLCRPEIGWKYFDKLKPEPARSEKPGLIYNSAAA